jgi:hypothetical protein
MLGEGMIGCGMKYRATPPETRISIDHKNKVYQATYFVEKGMVTVSYGTLKAVTQLGRMPPATLAKMMLRELVANPKSQVGHLQRLDTDL